MAGRHELDAGGASPGLLKENVREPLRRHAEPLPARADFVVLTEAAAQIAVGEEDRARTRFPGNAGLLPGVKAHEGYFNIVARAADAALQAGCRGTVGIAAPWAEIADHDG